MTHETNDPPIQPKGEQIMMGASWDQALREVGVIPRDCYTQGGVTLRFGVRRDAAELVIADVPIILPADKLRAALDVVDRIEGPKVNEVELDDALSAYATELMGRQTWVTGWRDVDRLGFWVEVHCGDPNTQPHTAIRDLLTDVDRDDQRRVSGVTLQDRLTEDGEMLKRWSAPYRDMVHNLCDQLKAMPL